MRLKSHLVVLSCAAIAVFLQQVRRYPAFQGSAVQNHTKTLSYTVQLVLHFPYTYNATYSECLYQLQG